MEAETRTEADAFGNYMTNRYPCPRCGNEFLEYIGGWDSHFCPIKECGWGEGVYGDSDDPEKIDYKHPVRERAT